MIEIQAGKVPVKQRAFQLVGERREAMNNIITSLVEEGKIEKGVSPWSSPAFPVAKKDKGTYRLVVDYRLLNAATVPDAYHLP